MLSAVYKQDLVLSSLDSDIMELLKQNQHFPTLIVGWIVHLLEPQHLTSDVCLPSDTSLHW